MKKEEILKQIQNLLDKEGTSFSLESLTLALNSVSYEQLLKECKEDTEYQKIRIKNWLDEMDIQNYTINDNLKVDVNNHVFLQDKKLQKIPVKFGVVQGNFEISNNLLTDLTNSPDIVKMEFDCSHNYKLRSLNGSPQEVGSFKCNNNTFLFDLKGCTPIVKKDFNCSYNKLQSLEGGPLEVYGLYDCSYNELTSLKGMAKIVGNRILCPHNKISNINDLPEKTLDVFCRHNPIQINELILANVKHLVHSCLKGKEIELFREFYIALANPDFVELRIDEQIWNEKMAYLESKQIKKNMSDITKPSFKNKIKL